MKHPAYLAVAFSIFSMPAFGAPPRDKVYQGTYFYNVESSLFTPDGSKDTWCLHGDMNKAELPPKGPGGPWGTAHVVVRGELGPPGHYCNMGAFKYLLTVHEVLDIKDPQSQR